MSLSRSLAVAFVAGLACASVATSALAQSSCVVDKSERDVDCAKVPQFSQNMLDVAVPNNSFFWLVRATTTATFRAGPQDHYRQTSGFGSIVGVAPLSNQALRVSVGADLFFGRWAGDHGAFTLQPEVRVAFLNRKSVWFGDFVPSDLFVGVVLPATFGARGGLDVGAEIGFLWRPANAAEIGVSGQVVGVSEGFVPDGAPSAVHTLERISLFAGFDLNSMLGWHKKPVTRQTHADLRCPFFRDAIDLWRREGGTQHEPSYCAAVDKAIASLYQGRASGDPLRAFWTAIDDARLGSLAKQSDRFDRCVETNRREQRACIDCTNPKKTLRVWYAYTMDPFQAAAALGCQPGVTPSDLQCAEDEPALADPHVVEHCAP